MSDLQDVLRYSELLNIYQGLLSKTQKEILEDYFLANLSFSEIAENRKISRSAVEDAVRKGKKNLDDYEEQLCSLRILHNIRKLKSKTDDKEVLKILDEIEREITHGI